MTDDKTPAGSIIKRPEFKRREASTPINTHHQVGKEAREEIRRIRGTPAENLPAAEPIQQVKKRLQDLKPKLELEDKDTKGLEGTR